MADLLQILGSVEQQRRQDLYNIAQPQINMLKQDIAMQEQRDLIKEEKVNEIKSLGFSYDPNRDIDLQLGEYRRERSQLTAKEKAETSAKQKYGMTFGEEAPKTNIFTSFGKKAEQVEEDKYKEAMTRRQTEEKRKFVRGIESEYTPEEIKKAGVDINQDPYKASAILKMNRKQAEIDRLLDKKNASLIGLETKDIERLAIFNDDFAQMTSMLTNLTETKFGKKNPEILAEFSNKIENNESVNMMKATRLIKEYLEENGFDEDSDEYKALFEQYFANINGYNQNVGFYKAKKEESDKNESGGDKGITLTEDEKKNIPIFAKRYEKSEEDIRKAILYLKKEGKSLNEARKIIESTLK